MTLRLIDVLAHPQPCACACHQTLTLEERTQGIAALYRLDDALRGWDYQPLYELGAHQLWREAQARNDTGYRGIALRDHACIYRRLVGFAVHESIHALGGDVSRANYGIPFGLPYGVPEGLPAGDERAYLEPFNQSEARAFVGVAPLAWALFGIEWELFTARDVGTYGFCGGNALVEVPPGFRAVPHVDRQLQPQRYYALARRLESEARSWFSETRLGELKAQFEAAEARGRDRRSAPYPPPAELARIAPRPPGRNDPCGCGSGKKAKRCCGV